MRLAIELKNNLHKKRKQSTYKIRDTELARNIRKKRAIPRSQKYFYPNNKMI